MHSTRRAKGRSAQLSSETKPEEASSTTPTATTAAAARVSDSKCRSALLVVGTYHSVMAGLVYRRDKFAMLFSIKHHEGCINSVAVGEKYMVSSGTDERIFLFTNKSQKHLTSSALERLRAAGESLSVRLADLGHVSPPSEVRCLLLTPNSQHLLCGCADGQLVVYRTRDWSVGLVLPLHERGVAGIAVHPGGSGALAVTIGDDRRVAVLDLARGRLLSKWRYGTSPAVVETERDAWVDDAHESGEKGEDSRRAKRARMERRDGPHAVKFSPSGRQFAIISRHAFAVYETERMCLVARYQAPSPQPRDELHVFAFVDDSMMLFGNESGELLYCCGPWGSDDTQPRDCTLQQVSTHIPSEAAQRLEADRRPGRHPTRHTTRLKALHCAERTVFSLDATGVVIAWHVEDLADTAMTLAYVCSANCQGRATTMDVLQL